MEVSTEKSGPLFSGATHRAIGRGLEDATEDVGDRGVLLVRQRLSQVLREPTGYYESRIDSLAVPDGAEITDGGVIYGPWLEGVGSMNQSTRFKGYHTFREIGQQLDAQAGPIADAAIGKALGGVS